MSEQEMCTVEGCDKYLYRQGMCHMHRNRVRRSGSTDARRDPRFDAPKKPVVHGTNRAYQTFGCRCEECKQGTRERAKAYHGRYKATIAERRLLKEYGLSKVDYDRMLSDQGGACLICGGLNEGKQLFVDHCHTTGAVRGLLCTRCNTGLGMFSDDPDRLLSAATYLLQQADVIREVHP